MLCAPGNAGIAADATCLPDVGTGDVGAIVDAARSNDAGLVIVGPEAPLVGGAVDALEQAGVPAFGPGAAAAKLEGSKAFAKQLMAEASVPTASHTVMRSHQEALEHISCASYPAVLKADGLAAGKGVIICANEGEARDAAAVFFTEQRFGETEVVLEEFLEGEELSLLALCDGENVLPRLRSDLLGLCLASREPGGLAGAEAEFADDWAVTVVLASKGYPETSSKGDVISGLDDAAQVAEVVHAGTVRRDGDIVTAGGRVLNVTGLGPTPADARERAYDAARRISFDGMQLRSDIAARAVERVAG